MYLVQMRQRGLRRLALEHFPCRCRPEHSHLWAFSVMKTPLHSSSGKPSNRENAIEHFPCRCRPEHSHLWAFSVMKTPLHSSSGKPNKREDALVPSAGYAHLEVGKERVFAEPEGRRYISKAASWVALSEVQFLNRRETRLNLLILRTAENYRPWGLPTGSSKPLHNVTASISPKFSGLFHKRAGLMPLDKRLCIRTKRYHTPPEDR